MGQVSQAERWVNEYCGKSFTAGSAPDGVVSATLYMAKYFMDTNMLEDGHIEELSMELDEVENICKGYLARHTVKIEYSSNSSEFRL
ncbi:hypothetical protein LCGC14_0708660 [marine sediment metagenome]|uniref:Uncharacterized protein n=1 Tax=marine sediment metagenome TaxID=412755 RepID=A0A0F9R159_9ZZZZ